MEFSGEKKEEASVNVYENTPEIAFKIDSIIPEEYSNKPPTSDNSQLIFYGVHLPSDSPITIHDNQVYTDRVEALRNLKQNKRARFKAFLDEADAKYFAKYGCTMHPTISPANNPSCALNQSPSNITEKSLYKALKTQDLIKFKKAVELTDFPLVKKFIDENPRYLISSGDTPSILQEGPRYNALHIAARNNAPEIVSYILSIISSSELTDRIYGTQGNGQDPNQRAKVLLDLYLNTPDKALGETPLHFASKIGALAVVQVLTFYPECARHVQNKYGLTPLGVVCTRAHASRMANKEVIISLLKDNYYIPVLRSEDNTVQPSIGEPITLTNNLDPSSVIQETPVSPRMQLHALAGPMSKQKANDFRKKWKTPPRLSYSDSSLRPSLYDADKGLEIIGRNLSTEFSVHWTEYWSFLDKFINLSSTEGLNILESYLNNKFHTTTNADTQDPTCSKDKKYIFEYQAENFMHRTTEIINEGLHSSLLSKCQEELVGNYSNEDHNSKIEDAVQNNKSGQLPISPISDISYKLSMLHIGSAEKNTPPHGSNYVPVLCFEKYLDIFAKRLSASLSKKQNIDVEVSRLQMFLASCSHDKRFDCINLTKAHYRTSQLVVFHLNTENTKEDVASLLTFVNDCKSNIANQEKQEEKLEIVRIACLCILSFLGHFLSLDFELTAGDEKWLHCIPCNCEVLHNKTKFRSKILPCRKRLTYSEGDGDSTLQSGLIQGENFHDLTIDDFQFSTTWACPHSDNDQDEFVTPPSSPTFMELVPKDNDEDEEFVDCPQSHLDVFLAGEKPSKLDASVLQAISSAKISSDEYPFIYFWKKSCEDKSILEPKERWPTPMFKLNPTQMKFDR